MILYIYKIINKMVPDPGIGHNYDPRRKWEIKPKYANNPNIVCWKRKARNSSFFSSAPQLYNMLPPHLRELEINIPATKANLNTYKRKLDGWLSHLLDDPGDSTNSLLADRHRFANWRQLKGGITFNLLFFTKTKLFIESNSPSRSPLVFQFGLS